MVREITNDDMSEFYELPKATSWSHYASSVGDKFNWMVTQSCFAEKYKKYIDFREKDLKRYRYLITFTLDPKKPAFETTEELYILIDEYIEKLGRSAQYQAVHWGVVREYHKPPRDNVAHWHVSVISKTIIKESCFKYFIRVYGNVQISKSRKPEQEFALNYMSKDSDIVLVI